MEYPAPPGFPPAGASLFSSFTPSLRLFVSSAFHRIYPSHTNLPVSKPPSINHKLPGIRPARPNLKLHRLPAPRTPPAVRRPLGIPIDSLINRATRKQHAQIRPAPRLGFFPNS